MEKIVFDLLVNTSENRQLKEFKNLFLEMLMKNPDQVKRFIDKRILQPKPKDKSDEKTFFENLISTLDSSVREMTSSTLSGLVNRLFAIDDYETIDKIMGTALGFLPEEASKNWLKIEAYL